MRLLFSAPEAEKETVIGHGYQDFLPFHGEEP